MLFQFVSLIAAFIVLWLLLFEYGVKGEISSETPIRTAEATVTFVFLLSVIYLIGGLL